MKSQLRYAAICADLVGRQCVKIGKYENQPSISQKDFNTIKTQLLHINPNLKISKKQAQILFHQNDDLSIYKNINSNNITINNFICRNDIKKICNKVDPGFDMRSEAKLFIEPLFKKCLKDILDICNHLLIFSKKKTLTEEICEASIQLLLPQELNEHALIYAQRAIKIYQNKYDETDSKGKVEAGKVN